MPRIPVRVEPYSSPSRQHRHYKNKRDQVLRALGKAAYINGSHFAIMWVSARGDVETYASEALQSRLDDWFVKGGIAEEAKQLVRNTAGGCSNANVGAKVFEDLLSDEDDDDDDDAGVNAAEVDDVFTDSNGGNVGGNKENEKQGGVMMAGGGKGKRGPLAPLNTAIANQHFLRSRSSFGAMMGDDMMAPKSAPLFPTSSAAGFADDGAPRTSTPLLNTSSRLLSRNSLSSSSSSGANLPLTTNSSTAPTIEITLANEAARTAFLELRFGQLQQGVCKTVAKAWIKIIEPKKQTRCPYNKGEAGKPDWWPAGVRHKEPDHLMKPERHALLLTILRSPKVQVARLQLATAEVVALIKADKVSLLMDVYRIAREEEKLREKGEANKDEVVKVGVSTLDGWCSEQNGMTVAGRQIARSVTPEMVAEKKSNGKRAASHHMAKSNSASGLAGGGGGGPNKRRSIATTISRSAEVKSRPLPAFLDPHNNNNNNHNHNHHHHHHQHHHQLQQQQQQQQQQHGNMIGLGLMAPGIQPRSQSFSAASSRSLSFATQPTTAANTAANSTDTSPLTSSSCWPNTTNSYNFSEVNGLVTPLTGTSVIDPSFHADLGGQSAQQQQQFPSSADLNAFTFYQSHSHQSTFYPSSSTHTHVHAGIFDNNSLGLTATQGWNFGSLDLSDSSVDLSTTTNSYTEAQCGTLAETSFSLDEDSIDPPRTPSPTTIANANLRLNLPQSKLTNSADQIHHPNLDHHHLWLNPEHHHQNHHPWQQHLASQPSHNHNQLSQTST